MVRQFHLRWPCLIAEVEADLTVENAPDNLLRCATQNHPQSYTFLLVLYQRLGLKCQA